VPDQASGRLRVDLQLDPFDATWPAVRDAAVAAGAAGWDGIWLWDHLAGQSHGADRVLECWTTLSALAPVVPRVALGPLVLNVAYRRPAVLATMAATLQEVSGGRLILGLGAGGGRGVPYTAEQAATGLPVPPDPVRRRQVREAIHVLRQLWTGRSEPFAGEHYPLGEATGFLRPDPPPPVVVAAFGPKTARLAGECADGITTHAAHPDRDHLVAVAREARAASGGDPVGFAVVLTAPLTAPWLDPGRHRELEAAGVDRLVLLARPPFPIGAIAKLRAEW
jgi:alkanesulfonate monooxygenase SsuD/methylene tetrahydromethanopterin reductase-like flavin-dependent oxidoreductase (luciferase family)